MAIDDDLRALLAHPRDQQLPRARALLATPTPPLDEAWNSRFGPGSLFEAWCGTSVARRAHAALRDALRPAVAAPGFRVIDVGGGDGSVWRGLLGPEHRGQLVVVDPLAEAAERVRAAVPAGVEVRPIVAPVQQADLPDADVVVCSLTLHHVAGADAAHRARHGLAGPGKREVLENFGRSLRPRGGFGLLVEADVDCEIDLPPGADALAENLLDSYVRRCARSILVDDLPHAEPERAARLRAILRHWMLGQLGAAEAPLADRDVYELRVHQWLDRLAEAGLTVEHHAFTDDLPLFHLYRFR